MKHIIKSESDNMIQFSSEYLEHMKVFGELETKRRKEIEETKTPRQFIGRKGKYNYAKIGYQMDLWKKMCYERWSWKELWHEKEYVEVEGGKRPISITICIEGVDKASGNSSIGYGFCRLYWNDKGEPTNMDVAYSAAKSLAQKGVIKDFGITADIYRRDITLYSDETHIKYDEVCDIILEKYGEGEVTRFIENTNGMEEDDVITYIQKTKDKLTSGFPENTVDKPGAPWKYAAQVEEKEVKPAESRTIKSNKFE